MKTEVVRFRITPELKAKLQAAAAAENRTMSNFLENLVEIAYEGYRKRLINVRLHEDHADLWSVDNRMKINLNIDDDLVDEARSYIEDNVSCEEAIEDKGRRFRRELSWDISDSFHISSRDAVEEAVASVMSHVEPKISAVFRSVYDEYEL